MISILQSEGMRKIAIDLISDYYLLMGKNCGLESPLPDYGRVTQIAFEDESTIYGTIQWSLGDDFPSEQDGFYFFRYDISGAPLVFDQYFSQIYNFQFQW